MKTTVCGGGFLDKSVGNATFWRELPSRDKFGPNLDGIKPILNHSIILDAGIFKTGLVFDR